MRIPASPLGLPRHIRKPTRDGVRAISLICRGIVNFLGILHRDPAVLRQMKANGSEVLLLRDYVGTGATREQFIKTFATAAKCVVFLRDVEAQQ